MIGNNFARWYNQTEGSLFAEGTLGGGKSGSPWLTTLAGANTNDDVMGIVWATKILGNITANGTSTFNNSVGPDLVNLGPFKACLAYKTNDSQVAASTFVGSLDTSVVLPQAIQLLIARPARFQPMPNCTISRIAYYPRRLADSELQGITS
jgi:hypothetical protein